MTSKISLGQRLFGNTIPSEQLLLEIEDLIRTMPPREALGNDSSDVLAWIGRASAAIRAWNSSTATLHFDGYVRNLGATASIAFDAAVRGVIVTLHQAQHDLRMQTSGPLSSSVPQGAVFQYFDELRKMIELARNDLLFVDPYLDADFVSRYLPHVPKGATVRLLGRHKIDALVSAAQLFAQQEGMTVSVRSSPALHDRYLFVDGTSCYQSGASFNAGAKKSSTTLTQITDAFMAVLDTYEKLWTAATPRP